MTHDDSGPPPALVRSLVDGPSSIRGLEWHREAGSTNDLAWEAAARGVGEIHVLGADVQRAGRGRLGRVWEAPAGTSLTLSLVLRPRLSVPSLPLLPLLAGVVLSETIARSWPDADVTLKWPNDVLLAGRKTSGILAEGPRDGAVVVGMGVNVDWRGVTRPAALAEATSLAEAVGTDVDRWRLLAALLALFGNAYAEWSDDPTGFLGTYRGRCSTLGRTVRVTMTGGEPVTGEAVGISDDGALLIGTPDGQLQVSAGDVEHVRPA